jgi:hypothetical protein
MRQRHDRRASAVLTRHFVQRFFDFGFGSDAAIDGMRRLLLGILSAMVAIGLFLPRIYRAKYFALRSMAAYQDALLGDQLLTLALPMLIVAFAAALAGDSMFPDETDFRVLTPLPISRGFVFAAKLKAVSLYLGVAIAVTAIALQLPFTAVSSRRWAEHPWLVRAAAHTATSMCASLFAALAVMSVQGAVVLCAPSRILRMMSVGARTAVLCGIVILAPLAARLTHQSGNFANSSPVLYFLPPAWFVGAERLLLGQRDSYSAAMSLMAIAAFAAAAGVVAACYLTLYRRFDAVILRAARPSSGERRNSMARARPFDSAQRAGSAQGRRDAIRAAQTSVVDAFASATLWRSPMHQVVFFGIAACGVGWAINSLLNADVGEWARSGGARSPQLVNAIVRMPFVLMLFGATGLRAALLLPQDSRANWIFRMSDADEFRAHRLDAVERMFLRLIVAPVVILTLPLQWAALGAVALIAVVVNVAWAMLLVELFIRQWRRIPFTCSYIPGKREVTDTFLRALVVFVIYTTIGAGLVRFVIADPARLVRTAGILAIVVLLLRHVRSHTWGRAPLLFDDELPDAVQPLRLSSD